MHYSPQVTLIEGIRDILMFIFFLHHSWRYDKWQCLKFWRLKTNREVFRRVMIWGYAFGLPLNAFKTLLCAVIKYEVGFLPASEGGYPVPYYLWPSSLQWYIKPLSILDSILWFTDLTVHSEETCFWFFLTRTKTNSKPWFSSIWFKIFIATTLILAGSSTAITYIFINEPLKLEAVAYLVYGVGTFFQCACFGYIFYIFPKFISQLYGVSGTSDVLSKLLSFHEINKIRVVARTIFAVVITIDAIDGLTRTQPINHNAAIVDVLLMTAVLTSGVGSMTTLLVFLPRNPLKERGLSVRPDSMTVDPPASQASRINVPVAVERTYHSDKFTSRDFRNNSFRSMDNRIPDMRPGDVRLDDLMGDEDGSITLKSPSTADLEFGVFASNVELTNQRKRRKSQIGSQRERRNLPAPVRYYSSPIDIADSRESLSQETHSLC